MHTFELSSSPGEGGPEWFVVTRDGPHGHQQVVAKGPGQTAQGSATLEAIRMAYAFGRKDEAAIRAAAMGGLMSGSPLV